MIKKYIYGEPFNTDAVVAEIPASEGKPEFGEVIIGNGKFSPENGKACPENGFCFTYKMGLKDKVYGLGENVRGINKRGYEYISDTSDEPHHQEDKKSLYAAHNFIIVDGRETFGLFVDYPSVLTFDIGYKTRDNLVISCKKCDLNLYVITGENAYDIVRQFRKIIGRSYIAPKFAFGFGQSRWGYSVKEDFREVVRKHRENHVPLDMVYMDIDYMQDFKDFTVNEKEFDHFSDFVQEMKDQNIRLIPIIDAGVKIEKGYSVYDEGVEKGFFCKRADGSNFVATVWPGETHFPDVLNKDAREWFGGKYKILLDQGIEGFWNDMNEPAIFHTPESLESAKSVMQAFIDHPCQETSAAVMEKQASFINNHEDYKNCFHNVDGRMVCHDDVHNLFGYNMTRAAGEAFERLKPEERVLIFSRSSYVGMHRYGGIWQGDNYSWWSHILLNLKMLPSLNMVGILYTGADLGGFGYDASRDLVLRWLELGVFTPLMRNHSALGTRRQEFYQFEDTQDFRHVISVRYRLLPYIYSEYMKAALNDDLMFKPLAFEYPDDEIAAQVEDQLMLGNEIMIAPVYLQNADGRFVYLPEDMKFVKFMPDGSICEEELAAGVHYVKVELNEVPLFIRKGRCIPVAEAAECVSDLDTKELAVLGWEGAQYDMYEDDGIHKDYENPKNYRIIRK